MYIMRGKADSAVSLYPSQYKWFKKINEILDQHPFYWDRTETGGGKTRIAIAVAQQRELACVTICPNSLKDGWNLNLSAFDVDYTQVINYDNLRTTSCPFIEPLNGQPSEWFKQLVDQRGILLIIDEYQKIKNSTTDVTQLTYPLIKYIRDATSETGKRSKIAFLSALAFDKGSHYTNMAKQLDLISTSSIAAHVRQHSTQGEEIISSARRAIIEESNIVDEDKINDVIESYLFNTQLAPNLVGGAKLTIPTADCYRYNGSFEIGKQIYDNMGRGIFPEYHLNQIRDNYKEAMKLIQASRMNVKTINNVIIRLESAKIWDMARVAVQWIINQSLENPGSYPRVVCMLSYKLTEADNKAKYYISSNITNPVNFYDTSIPKPTKKIDTNFNTVFKRTGTPIKSKEPIEYDVYYSNGTDFVMLSGSPLMFKKFRSYVIDIAKALQFPMHPFQVLEYHGDISSSGTRYTASKERILNLYETLKAPCILLITQKTGSEGLNLQDRMIDGIPRPTLNLISSTYLLVVMYQAAGRTYRVGTKTDTVVTVFYGKNVKVFDKDGNPDELREKFILENLQKRSLIAQSYFADEFRTLPLDYIDWSE